MSPPHVGTESIYLKQAIDNSKLSGDGQFTKMCNKWIEQSFNAGKALLTASGSSALDMAALLCEINPGDEVILPSYTFSSTANAFVLAGAKLVFVDIRPDTMNIDEQVIEDAITDKTRVICVVHYAGVACEMDTIMSIAKKYNLLVVEDAAQGFMSTYKGKPLGTIGNFGCYSFHETKNFTMGEGGAIVINNLKYIEKAEILREKGTNRSQFYRGQVAKYNWIDYGDSYLPSELNAAYLWAQLQVADTINKNRLDTWYEYDRSFKRLREKGLIDTPHIPAECKHNAHMYYIKCKTLKERTQFINYMESKGIKCVFHYVPLHSSPAGLKYGTFNGKDQYTTVESDRLVRIPMYYNMDVKDRDFVIQNIIAFFERSMK